MSQILKIAKTLPPTGKSTLRFFCIKSTSILGNGTVFYFYLEKFGFDIFPDLKSKQSKWKKIFKKN